MRNTFGALVTVASLAAGVATATAGPFRRPADAAASVSALSGGLNFSITVPYERAVLAVSGPTGVVFDKEFPAGIAPAFPATSDTATPLRDGRYNYALRIMQAAGPDIAGPDAAAASPDTQPARRQRMLVRLGSFVVRAGVLVIDDTGRSERPDAEVTR